MKHDRCQLNETGQGLRADSVGPSWMAGAMRPRYIREFSVTSSASEPTILEQAFGADVRDEASHALDALSGAGGELFVEWALADTTPLAELAAAVTLLAFGDPRAPAERLQREAVSGFSTSWCAFHPVDETASG